MIISDVPRGVSAAILAGGRARRFGGADKASLIVGGARIIDRQLGALDTVADDIRIVANEPDRYATLGVRVIPDQIAGAGPLGGLHAALTGRARRLTPSCRGRRVDSSRSAPYTRSVARIRRGIGSIAATCT
jgi:hypothetical protein